MSGDRAAAAAAAAAEKVTLRFVTVRLPCFDHVTGRRAATSGKRQSIYNGYYCSAAYRPHGKRQVKPAKNGPQRRADP